jgi:thymidylate kinase
MKKEKPAFICIIGVDGVGKTAHINKLMENFKNEGIRCKYTWFRFYHFLSLLLLAYCRLVDLTVYEIKNGQKVGRHDFHKSKLISSLYPFVLFIDMLPMYFVKIYLPRRFGYTIVCDRFVYDTLIDLMIDLREYDIHKNNIGELFLGLRPEETIVIHLDLDENIIRKRRKDLTADQTLNLRRKLYNKLCKDLDIPTIMNDKPIDDVHTEIIDCVKNT